jgi:trans-aconitate 2-methyltransferase
MNASPREWDGEVYHRVSDPQFEWAKAVVERAKLNGNETVLDAGCGSGRVTELLVQRVPNGRVIGVDGSESMIEKAREVLGPDVELHVASLTDIEFDGVADLVFSNAVFHWILDHDLLFSRVHRALKPGGALVAQCGGEGNVAKLAEAIVEVASDSRYAQHFAGMEVAWNFSSPADTERRLHGAGFEDVECWLETKVVQPEEPLSFLSTVTLGPHLARLPAEDSEPFTEAVAARMPDPLTLEYVRLNIDARRPAR